MKKNDFKKLYYLYSRKNLGTEADLCDSELPLCIKAMCTYEYLIDFIKKNGLTINVYFIKGTRLYEKWAYDSERSWHTTNYKCRNDFCNL